VLDGGLILRWALKPQIVRHKGGGEGIAQRPLINDGENKLLDSTELHSLSRTLCMH